jgi:molecular chaperone GrpE
MADSDAAICEEETEGSTAPPENVGDGNGGTIPLIGNDVLQDLAGRLDAIRAILIERLNYDKTKEEAFERLYAELDDAKEGRVYDLLHPTFFDLILLHDRVEGYIRSDERENGVSAFLESVLGEIVEILARRSVEIIEVPSTKFDPTLQKAIGVKETAEPSKHHAIASVIRRGFRREGRIVRAEEVIIMKHVSRNEGPRDEESE